MRPHRFPFLFPFRRRIEQNTLHAYSNMLYLDRKPTNQSESLYRYFSFCWVTVFSKSRPWHVAYQRHGVTIRNSDWFRSRPNSLSFYVRFYCKNHSFFSFWYSYCFSEFHDDSYFTKLKKFDKRYVKNIPCQRKDIHWLEFIKECSVKWLK